MLINLRLIKGLVSAIFLAVIKKEKIASAKYVEDIYSGFMNAKQMTMMTRKCTAKWTLENFCNLNYCN